MGIIVIFIYTFPPLNLKMIDLLAWSMADSHYIYYIECINIFF